MRQTVRSNYCGVYSTAMLLSYFGESVNRASAIRMFFDIGVRSLKNGVTHGDIASVVLRHVRSARWRYFPTGLSRRASRFLKEHLNAVGPTVLTFGAVHYKGRLRARHAAVVLEYEADHLTLMDPLGKSHANCGNVRIRGTPGELVLASGAPYFADWSQLLSILSYSR